MVTKTHGKLHFEDLEPGRFEMLAMQIVYRMRRWERLDHYGAAGSDDGVDINAVELLENGKRNSYHFQCKRYDRLTKSQLVKIVRDYVRDNPEPADNYYLVCGCNPSKTAIEGFDAACERTGIKNFAVWSASYIETLLYTDYHDILFAYFGVNLSVERNNLIAAVRRNVALKKRMHKDFQKERISEQDLQAVRKDGEYWRKFKHSEVLIRSIYDKNYPEQNIEFPGYYKAEVYNWYHNGLEVRTHPYAVNARIKQRKMNADPHSEDPEDYEIIETQLDVFGCIPFENIIEYDTDGDEYYRYPHLFCDYPCGEDPYEEIRYRFRNGYPVDKDDIEEIL